MTLPGSLTSFFFNDTATTEIYTLSLHDALPIYRRGRPRAFSQPQRTRARRKHAGPRRHGCRGRTGNEPARSGSRSEEHTSELQSRLHLVCRLLLEKKNKKGQKRTAWCSTRPPKY